MSPMHPDIVYHANALVKQVNAIMNVVPSDDLDMAPEDVLYNELGLDIDEDGTVYDPCYDKTFASVTKWAMYEAEQEFGDLTGHGRGQCTKLRAYED